MDEPNEHMSKMVEKMRAEQRVQINYGLAEGFLKYAVGPSGSMHLTHTTPEDLDVDPVAIFSGLEDVLAEITAVYGVL